MTPTYLGEIRMFAANFAPQGWRLCDGALLNISDHRALFNLLDTRWGGDGTETFALPDLRGRIPVGQGAGEGLAARTVGEMSGTETVTLKSAELPVHNHLVNVVASPATAAVPGNTVNLAATAPPAAHYLKKLPEPPQPARYLEHGGIGETGGRRPHENVMPSVVVNFIICIQ